MLALTVVIGGGWVVVLADLAHGAVALVSVSRGICVELRRVPAMSACYLIVAGGIGDVRVIVFVGSHDGRQPRLENQRMGGMIRVCRAEIAEVVKFRRWRGTQGGVFEINHC